MVGPLLRSITNTKSLHGTGQVFLEDGRKTNQRLLSSQTLLSAPKVPEQQFAGVLQDSVTFWLPVLLPKATAVGHYQKQNNKFYLALAWHAMPILICECCTAMGLCAEHLRWRRGRAAGAGDVSSVALQWKEKPTPWTWSVTRCIAQNPDALQPDTPHGPACLLIATLVGELSNTKPNALQLQTALANFWSRNTDHFFTWSLVGWAGHAAGATRLPHPDDLRNLTFSPASQETSHPGIPIAATSQADGLPMQQGIKWEALHQKKDAESYLWGTFHQFTPDEVLMPEFGWLSPFFLWVCWALSYGT